MGNDEWWHSEMREDLRLLLQNELKRLTDALQLATLMVAGGTLGYLLGPHLDSGFWGAIVGAAIHFAWQHGWQVYARAVLARPDRFGFQPSDDNRRVEKGSGG